MSYDKKFRLLMSDSLSSYVLLNFEKNTGRKPTEDDLDLLIDMKKKGPSKLMRPLNWIKDLERITNSIVSEKACPSDYGLFWIRLYDCLSFIPTHFQKKLDTLVTMGAESKDGLKPFIQTIRNLLASFDSLKREFNSQEALLIDFMRQSHAHLFQAGFEYETKKIKTNLEVKNTYKGSNISDINNFIESSINKLGGNESALALSYATRSQKYLSEIIINMETYLSSE